MKGDQFTAEDGFRVRYIGPFERHDVVVDGWRVPLLDAHPHGEDKVRLTLDRRISVDLNAAEAEKVVPFVADAIAVALGYAAHPREGLTELVQAPALRPRRVSGLTAAASTA